MDALKHAGQARWAASKLIFLATLVAFATGLIDKGLNFFPSAVCGAVAAILLLFVLFTLYFFRDPNPRPPDGPGLVVSPGHGKVDVLDRLENSSFFGGPCHRISIFLSVIDVHVQNAPISGKIDIVTHTPGKFVSALQTDCADYNENVLIGFASTETVGERIGLRLIAGVLARRIVPFVAEGDELARGERISLIQFGSRCDVYLPPNYKIQVKLGDRVVGGQTVVASK